MKKNYEQLIKRKIVFLIRYINFIQFKRSFCYTRSVANHHNIDRSKQVNGKVINHVSMQQQVDRWAVDKYIYLSNNLPLILEITRYLEHKSVLLLAKQNIVFLFMLCAVVTCFFLQRYRNKRNKLWKKLSVGTWLDHLFELPSIHGCILL